MDQQTAATSDTFALRVRHVRTWAMATGHVAAPEALLLICEVKAAGEDPFDRWTLAHVDELLWAKLVGRCRSDGRPLPEYLVESLWTYLGYLAAHDLIDRPLLPALRAPLLVLGGLGPDGRRRVDRHRRHGADRTRKKAAPRNRPAGPEQVPGPVPAPQPDDRPLGEPALAPIIPLRPRRTDRAPVGA